MKLNQVIAIEQGVKKKGNEVKSELYKLAQKPTLFGGFVKKYAPKNEDGETQPDEKYRVQVRANELLDDFGDMLRGLFNIEATKDYANTLAKADIVVDGVVLVQSAPTTFLLYLQKELTDLATLVAAFPTLSEDDEWKFDSQLGVFRTDAVETIRTKKVQKAIVLYPATDKHPAQTQLVSEDEVVGYWQTIKHSGAITREVKKKLQEKIQKLSDAVKSSREQANMTEAAEQKAGDAVVKYLFADIG